MSRVYGDSTPFPHDVDYIEMVRDGVECAVHLLSAHHSIRSASERVERVLGVKQTEIGELGELFERVQEASRGSICDGLDRTVAAAAQLIASARGQVDRAIADAESSCEGELAQTRQMETKARESALGAIERFVARHAAPGSDYGLELCAEGEGYRARVTVETPYDLHAVFAVGVPADHAFARPRRVGDFVNSLEVHLPKEAGWIAKRVEMSAVRLEKLFVSQLGFAADSASLRLTRAAAGGAGYDLSLDQKGERPRAEIREVLEDGALGEGEPLVLDGADEATIVALLKRLREVAWGLVPLRRRLISGSFAGSPLASVSSPREVADALIGDMAPLVCEISRRSGAPGELVLRRDQGEGRREETYCTHVELLDKIFALPPDLWTAFSALELRGEESPGGARPPVPAPVPRDRFAASSEPGSEVHATETVSNRPPSVPPPESSPPAA